MPINASAPDGPVIHVPVADRRKGRKDPKMRGLSVTSTAPWNSLIHRPAVRLVPWASLIALLGVGLGMTLMTPAAKATVPPFASTYAGTVVDETYGIETTMELTEVQEGPAGSLKGQLVIGPGLVGNGAFEGTVQSDGALVLIVPHPAGFDRTELTGEVTPTGTMHGNYVIEPGPQVGRWEVSPKAMPVPTSPTMTPVPPTVVIVGHPPRETPESTASFSFSGASGGTYECSIDAGAWKTCVSGDAFGPLEPGDHRFQVRETLNGLTGPATSYFWTIDLPPACILKVARARVFAFAHQGKARLVIHYKAYKPAQVAVSYHLKGSKGGLALGSASSSFKTAGIFRLAEKLGRADVAKLRATSSMTVHFSIPEAPTRCSRYYTKRLTIPKKIFGQTVWFQSDSMFTSR